MLEDFGCTWVLWGPGNDRSCKTKDPKTVQNDRGIVQVSQHPHAEGVDKAMADKNGRIDAKRLCGGCHKIGLDTGCSRNQAGTAEANSGGNSKLFRFPMMNPYSDIIMLRGRYHKPGP